MKDFEIAEWLDIANRDVHSAVLLKNGNEFTNSYYHCTQAVEKYLKAYLFKNDIKINHNHNISETLKKCFNHNNIFSSLIVDCNKMTANVNQLRYPKVIEITEKHIKDSFILIDKIKNIEPIKLIFDELKEKYGDNWENVLFKKVLTIETDVSSKNKLNNDTVNNSDKKELEKNKT